MILRSLVAAAALTYTLTGSPLVFPTLNDLAPPAFVQPFAGVSVGAGGVTTPFFSNLPDGAFPGNQVLNVVGNFLAFDPLGDSPSGFAVTGVRVSVAGGPEFTPAFGELDFDGAPSLTVADSLDFDSVTYLAGSPHLAFVFTADASLEYSYSLLTTGLAEGSFLVFDDAETTYVPEPGMSPLLALFSWAALALRRRKARRRLAALGIQ
jgi:hypothetical protein